MSDDITEVETEEDVVTETDDAAVDGADELGDAGKRALDAMKAQRNAERAKARSAQQELDRMRAELAAKDKPAEEQALEAAKAEARAEATAQANQRILRSELKAAATGKLADPTDAALYIKLDDFEVSDDGDVDADALQEAIDDLITRKPHLAAGTQRRFDGGADQGAKGKDSRPTQLTSEDVDRMTPAQIVAAQTEGRLNKLLGITS